eukprot:TRINITY_DN20333_c0_g1_i7.p1 TRINITY_DN20333_c0_g1~~TRINITY_DN20333_c0_g1_i7.p1  ORF type:complete len:2290 (+),score=325.40 TRINITY_DN20333_c0_g1_i7:22-6870(+)
MTNAPFALRVTTQDITGVLLENLRNRANATKMMAQLIDYHIGGRPDLLQNLVPGFLQAFTPLPPEQKDMALHLLVLVWCQVEHLSDVATLGLTQQLEHLTRELRPYPLLQAELTAEALSPTPVCSRGPSPFVHAGKRTWRIFAALMMKAGVGVEGALPLLLLLEYLGGDPLRHVIRLHSPPVPLTVFKQASTSVFRAILTPWFLHRFFDALGISDWNWVQLFPTGIRERVFRQALETITIRKDCSAVNTLFRCESLVPDDATLHAAQCWWDVTCPTLHTEVLKLGFVCALADWFHRHPDPSVVSAACKRAVFVLKLQQPSAKLIRQLLELPTFHSSGTVTLLLEALQSTTLRHHNVAEQLREFFQRLQGWGCNVHVTFFPRYADRDALAYILSYCVPHQLPLRADNTLTQIWQSWCYEEVRYLGAKTCELLLCRSGGPTEEQSNGLVLFALEIVRAQATAGIPFPLSPAPHGALARVAAAKPSDDKLFACIVELRSTVECLIKSHNLPKLPHRTLTALTGDDQIALLKLILGGSHPTDMHSVIRQSLLEQEESSRILRANLRQVLWLRTLGFRIDSEILPRAETVLENAEGSESHKECSRVLQALLAEVGAPFIAHFVAHKSEIVEAYLRKRIQLRTCGHELCGYIEDELVPQLRELVQGNLYVSELMSLEELLPTDVRLEFDNIATFVSPTTTNQGAEMVCAGLRLVKQLRSVRPLLDVVDQFKLLAVSEAVSEEVSDEAYMRSVTTQNCRRIRIGELQSNRQFQRLEQLFHTVDDKMLQIVNAIQRSVALVEWLRANPYHQPERRAVLRDLQPRLNAILRGKRIESLLLQHFEACLPIVAPFTTVHANLSSLFDALRQAISESEPQLGTTIAALPEVNEKITVIDSILADAQYTSFECAAQKLENITRSGKFTVCGNKLRGVESQITYTVIASKTRQTSLRGDQLAEFVRQITFSAHHLRSLHTSRQTNTGEQTTRFLEIVEDCEAAMAAFGRLMDLGHPEFQYFKKSINIPEWLSSHPNQGYHLQADEWGHTLARCRRDFNELLMFSNAELANILVLQFNRAAHQDLHDTQPIGTNPAAGAAWRLFHYMRVVGVPESSLQKLPTPESPGEQLAALGAHLKGNVLLPRTSQPGPAECFIQKQFCKAFLRTEVTDLFHWLMSVFYCNHRRLPFRHEILWCTPETGAGDVDLHLLRAELLSEHTFVVFGINYLHDSLRGRLSRSCTVAATALIFVHFLGTPGEEPRFPLPFPTEDTPCVPWNELTKLTTPKKKNLQSVHLVTSELPGDGKTYVARRRLEEFTESPEQRCVIDINDDIDRRALVAKLLHFSFPGNVGPRRALLFNLSRYCLEPDVEMRERAMQEGGRLWGHNTDAMEANYLLFEMFVLGSVSDASMGSVFSCGDMLGENWQVVIENPIATTEATPDLLPVLRLLDIADVIKPPHTLCRPLSQIQTRVGCFLAMNTGKPHASADSIEGVLRNHFLDTGGVASHRNFALWLQALDARLGYFDTFTFNRLSTYFAGKGCMPHVNKALLNQFLAECKWLSTLPQEVSVEAFLKSTGGFLLYEPDGFPLPFDTKGGLPTRIEKIKYWFEGAIEQLSGIPEESFPVRVLAAALETPLHEVVREVLQKRRFVLHSEVLLRFLVTIERQRAALPLVLCSNTGVGKTYYLETLSELRATLIDRLDPEIAFAKQAPVLGRRVSALLVCLIDILRWRVQRRNAGLAPELEALYATSRAAEHYDNHTALISAFKTIAQEWDKLGPLEQGEEFPPSLQSETSRQAPISDADWHAPLQQGEHRFGLLLRGFVERLFGKRIPDVPFTGKIPMLTETPEMRALLKEPLDLDKATKLLEEFLRSPLRQLFHKLLLHPGLAEGDILQFLNPIMDLARAVPHFTVTVFFDEANTTSCMGFLKMTVLDRMIYGADIPQNVFFVLAVNPHHSQRALNGAEAIHEYNVHQLPPSLNTMVYWLRPVAGLEQEVYVEKSIKMLAGELGWGTVEFQLKPLASMVLAAHRFYERELPQLGIAVSQRDIQRAFKLVPHFAEILRGFVEPAVQVTSAVILAVGFAYYLRLPLADREPLDRLLFDQAQHLRLAQEPQIDRASQNTRFGDMVRWRIRLVITAEHIEIPPGIALNNALCENLLALLTTFVSRIPVAIVGKPGSSKTLSLHILQRNLKGDLSPKEFCRRFDVLDVFVIQGSASTTAKDISSVFQMAIEREASYQDRRALTRSQVGSRVLVCFDEGGLPPQNSMVMKALHEYLDDVVSVSCAFRTGCLMPRTKTVC